MAIRTDRPYLLKAWTGLAWWWIVGTPDDDPDGQVWQTEEYRTWADGMRAIEAWWRVEREMRKPGAHHVAPRVPT